MVQTTIRMPNKLHELIKQKARDQGVSLNSLVITTLWKMSGTSPGKYRKK